jgi:nucleotide-binding universal stress UspA family protein
MPRVQRIIAGIGGSPRSLPALRCAADLARAYEAEMVPVHAWIPPLAAFAGYQFPSEHLRRAWEDAAWQWLWQALEMACGGLPPDTLSQPVIAQGNPGLILVRTACRADDLLVIGTGRRDAVSRLWHGGVSRYCLAHARCPVLAIPPDRSVLAGSGLRGLPRRHRRMPGGRGRGRAFASRRTNPHPARRRSTHLPASQPATDPRPAALGGPAARAW